LFLFCRGHWWLCGAPAAACLLISCWKRPERPGLPPDLAQHQVIRLRLLRFASRLAPPGSSPRAAARAFCSPVIDVPTTPGDQGSWPITTCRREIEAHRHRRMPLSRRDESILRICLLAVEQTARPWRSNDLRRRAVDRFAMRGFGAVSGGLPSQKARRLRPALLHRLLHTAEGPRRAKQQPACQRRGSPLNNCSSF